jgi:hypothetical protein
MPERNPSQSTDVETTRCEQLQALEQLLSQRIVEGALAKVSGNNQPLNFFDLVERLPDSHKYATILKLISYAKLCCNAPVTPIFAVMGLLNAGKSSLVSTFLSDHNRKRILVGSANAQGTHRFVLWVPESWRQDREVWDFITNRIQSIFECQCEMLSESPETASLQYNDTSPRTIQNEQGVNQLRPTIEIPLIATDPELDRWGVAIMDCPDVQTGLIPGDVAQQGEQFHEHAQSISDVRWNVLKTAAPICSAFLIVLPANAMHDSNVSRLMRLLNDQMPNVHQILAVNRVPRRYESIAIHDEIKHLYGHLQVQREYMAYSFDGPNDIDRIPSPPDGYCVPTTQTLPLFFRIDHDSRAQPPESISQPDWLLQLGSQLDKKSLAGDVLNSTLNQLRTQIQVALQTCKAREPEMKRIVLQLQQTVSQACFEFASENKRLGGQPKVRLQASKHIVQQISQSLERTAPWWAMPGRWTTKIAEASKTKLANAGRSIAFPEWLRGASWFGNKAESIGSWIRSRWTSGESGKIITAEQLVDHLRRLDHAGHLKLDLAPISSTSIHRNSRIQAACQLAIDRFQNESSIALDDQQLDAFTAKMWADMPLSKRLLTGLAQVFCSRRCSPSSWSRSTSVARRYLFSLRLKSYCSLALQVRASCWQVQIQCRSSPKPKSLGNSWGT